MGLNTNRTALGEKQHNSATARVAAGTREGYATIHMEWERERCWLPAKRNESFKKDKRATLLGFRAQLSSSANSDLLFKESRVNFNYHSKQIQVQV